MLGPDTEMSSGVPAWEPRIHVQPLAAVHSFYPSSLAKLALDIAPQTRMTAGPHYSRTSTVDPDVEMLPTSRCSRLSQEQERRGLSRPASHIIASAVSHLDGSAQSVMMLPFRDF